MRAREAELGARDDALLAPVIDESGSDSAMLDNALELLVRNGRDVRQAAAMLVPEAWERPELEEDVRSFYRYHACLMEPWDGPAGLVFTDGRVVGAALDRNGLRPLRVAVRDDGLVVCSSEAGTVDFLGGRRVRRGMLGPGEMLAVDPLGAGVETNAQIKSRLASRRPYGRWLKRHLEHAGLGDPVAAPSEDLTPRQVAAGYTREELAAVLRPAAGSGHEPVSSMGDDTALPALAGRARPLFSYFRQRFAQVTNPPIDHLRERSVMSLRTLLGARAALLTESPQAARLVELELLRLPFRARTASPTPLDATLQAHESLEDGCERLARQAEAMGRAGAALLLVTDSAAGPNRASIPILLAVATVHHRLVQERLRSRVSILVDSDEPRESHHFACLLGYGADVVCPRLALETVAAMSIADRLGGDRPPPTRRNSASRTRSRTEC